MDTITYSKIKKMSPPLVVTDIERSIEFYTNTLALTYIFDMKIFQVVSGGDQVMIIVESNKSNMT